MLKLKNGCKVCKLLAPDGKKITEKQLLQRIYNSSHFVPDSEDSLKKIGKDYAGYFSYPGLLNHVRKHQFINDSQYRDSMLRNIAKKAEGKIIRETFQANNVQDAVINTGMEKLENGEMKVTATHLLKAAKDKSDAQAKVRDQQLSLAAMVAFFASGEDKQDNVKARNRDTIDAYDPSVPITEDIA